MAIGRTLHSPVAGNKATGVQLRKPNGRKLQASLTCTAEAIQPMTTPWQELQVLEMSMRFNTSAFGLPINGLSKDFTNHLRIAQSPCTLTTQQLVSKLHAMARMGKVPSWDWMQEALLVVQNILTLPIHSHSMDQSVSSIPSSPMIIDSRVLRPIDSSALIAPNHFVAASISSAPSLLQQPVYQPMTASQLCVVLWSIVRLYQLQAQQVTAWSQAKTAKTPSVTNNAGHITILHQDEQQQHERNTDHTESSPKKRRVWHHTQGVAREAVRLWRKPSRAWFQTVSQASLQFVQPQIAPPCTRFNGTGNQEGLMTGSIQSDTDTASATAAVHHVLDEHSSMQNSNLSSSIHHRVLATVSWALQTLSFRPEVNWLNTWGDSALPHMPDMSGHDLAQLLWAYGSWTYRPSEQWMQAAIARIQQLAVEQQLQPQDVAWVLWACARLQYDPGGEFVARVLHPDLLTIDPSIRAHAKQLRDQPLRTKPNHHTSSTSMPQQPETLLSSTPDSNQNAYDMAWTYKPMDTAQLLWALGKLSRRPHERSMHLLLCSLTYQRHDVSEQDVTLVVWALAKLNFKPAKALISRLSKIIGLRLANKQLSPRHVPMLLWGLAKLSWTLPPTLSTALLGYVFGASKHMTSEGSIMALYFAAKQQVQVEPWQLRCLMASALRITHAPPTLNNKVQARMSVASSSVAMLTDAANTAHTQLADGTSSGHPSAATQRQQDVVQFSTPSSAAALLWSLVRLQHTPPPAWFKTYFAATAQVLPHASGCDLWLMVQALAKMKHRPPRWWLRAVADRMRQLQQSGRLQEDHNDKLATVLGKLLPAMTH